MKFVELAISPTQRYSYKAASDIEMNILGDFLASDVGYRPLPFRQWAFNKASQNANGNLTALEKDADFILLTDIFAKEESSTALKMTFEQFVQILNDWQEKVCNVQPTTIIIQHENNQFVIKTKTSNEDIQTIPHRAKNSYRYLSLIKSCVILCYSLFKVLILGLLAIFLWSLIKVFNYIFPKK